MQRKSNILKPAKMRSGIALIMAIALLVILAGLMATILNISSNANKRTEHLYFQEQAQLLAKSATEFALLAVSGHNRLGNSSCVQEINSQYPPGANAYYDINTTIRYIGLDIGSGAPTGSCATNSIGPAISTEQSQGTLLIDVYVSSIDTNLRMNETISFHRRTIQKP